MFDKIIDNVKKYEGVLLYLIFGALTTVINTVVYYILYTKFNISNIVSNTNAWIAAVIFAFITNKVWVFKSKSFEPVLVLRELTSFILARLSRGLLDMFIMYMGVDVLGGKPMLSKVISNVFVVILNYVFSKLFIFRRKPVKSDAEGF